LSFICPKVATKPPRRLSTISPSLDHLYAGGEIKLEHEQAEEDLLDALEAEDGDTNDLDTNDLDRLEGDLGSGAAVYKRLLKVKGGGGGGGGARNDDDGKIVGVDPGTNNSYGEGYAAQYAYSADAGSSAYYASSSVSSTAATQSQQTMVDTMGLIGAIGDVFASNLSVNPFAIDPAKAVYTITFVCLLLFILIVGCTFMYQQQVRDYREFYETYVSPALTKSGF